MDDLAEWLRRTTGELEEFRHRHHRRRFVIMATDLAPGAVASFHATAFLDLADSKIDTTAVVTWTVDDAAALILVDNGSTEGVGSCTVTGGALAVETTANLAAIATDADGKSVESASWQITVSTAPPPPPADAVQVVITQDPAA